MAEYVAAALVSAGYAGATAAGVSATFTAISITYAAYSMADGQKKAREAKHAANDAISDRLVTVRSSAAPSSIIYGATRVAGSTIPYIVQHGALREYVTIVIPLARHKCADVIDVLFNDASIGPFSWATGYVLPGSKYYKTRPEPFTFYWVGGGIGSTQELPHTPIQNMGISTFQPGDSEGSGAGSIDLISGYDYTISGATVTLLRSWAGLTLNYTGVYSAGNGSELVRVKKFLGISAGERDTDLETNSGGEWTSAHVGKGVCRIHVTLKYDADIFGPIGIPNITAVVKGKEVYNWINGTIGWSDNAALCALDYLTDPMGFGIASGRINTVAAQTAQSIASEDVPAYPFTVNATTDRMTIIGAVFAIDQPIRFYNLGGALPGGISAGVTYYIRTVEPGFIYQISATVPSGSVLNITSGGTGTNMVMQARYTCNGQISTEAAPRDNLKLLCGAMAGSAVYSGGSWRVMAGAYVTPAYTLDESDLADGTLSVSPASKRRDLFNSVRGTFADPAKNYQTDDFSPYSSSTYVTADAGQEIWTDIGLPLTSDAVAAQRIAKLMLFKHRQPLTFAATWKLAAFPLQPGDTVYVRLARYGWDIMNSNAGKIFLVLRKKHSPQGTIEMLLQEEASAVYAWNYSEQENPNPSPNTALPDPSAVAQLANLTFVADSTTFDRLSDGTVLPYARFRWTAISDSAVLQGGRIEFIWKRGADVAWTTQKIEPSDTEIKLFGVSAGESIDVQIVVYNGAQAKSVPVFSRLDIGDVPSGLASGNFANYAANAAWTFDTGGWGVVSEGGATVAAEFYKETVFPLPGSIGNAVLYRNSLELKFMWAQPDQRIAVAPGQRICAAVKGGSLRSPFSVFLRFFNAAGASLGQFEGERLLPASFDATDISTYRQSWVMVVAPANTRSCDLILASHAPTVGTTGAAATYFCQPQIGPVLAGASEPPPWAPGINSAITRAQIAIGATYQFPVDWLDITDADVQALPTLTDLGYGLSPRFDIGPFDADSKVIVTAANAIRWQGQEAGSSAATQLRAVWLLDNGGIGGDASVLQTTPAVTPGTAQRVPQAHRLTFSLPKGRGAGVALTAIAPTLVQYAVVWDRRVQVEVSFLR